VRTQEEASLSALPARILLNQLPPLALAGIRIFSLIVRDRTDTIVNLRSQSGPHFSDGGDRMNIPLTMVASPIREQAANALLRARKLPPGPYRNDLRQLGVGLLQLYKKGLRANVQIVEKLVH
jgi:hypothetical protein